MITLSPELPVMSYSSWFQGYHSALALLDVLTTTDEEEARACAIALSVLLTLGRDRPDGEWQIYGATEALYRTVEYFPLLRSDDELKQHWQDCYENVKDLSPFSGHLLQSFEYMQLMLEKTTGIMYHVLNAEQSAMVRQWLL